MTKQRVTRRANLAAAGDDFTADSVEALLHDLFPSHTLPDRRVMQTFAVRINMIRANVAIQNDLYRNSHAMALAMQKSVPVVLSSLRSRRDALAAAVETIENAAAASDDGTKAGDNIEAMARRYREALAAGERVLADLARVQSGDEWFVRVEEKPQFPDNWTDHLTDILVASKEVAKALGLGIGKTRGSYAQLIAALVKRITGQVVSAETIYDHMLVRG